MADSCFPQRLLLVEDEAIIALAERQLLVDAGYHVETASSGAAAVSRVLQGEDIDLVLMDIDLGPGIDGTEAATAILAERDVPIVFLSSHAEREIVSRTEAITSYGYILKHAGAVVLLASIRMAFKLFEANRALQRKNEKLSLLLEVSRDFAASWQLEKVLQTAADRLAELTGLSSAAVYLLERTTLVLSATTPRIVEGFPAEYRRTPLKDHPHIARAIKTGLPVAVLNADVEQFTAAERAIAEARNLKSIWYYPLVAEGQTLGVLITGAASTRSPEVENVCELCVTLANMAAVAVKQVMELGNGVSSGGAPEALH